jgi:hypothetical protein
VNSEVSKFLTPLPAEVVNYILRQAKLRACHSGRCNLGPSIADVEAVAKQLQVRLGLALETPG